VLPCWREENLISTQLRLAAGICMLSAGLLIGSAGGGIAAADTDTGSAGPQSGNVEGASSAATSATEPAATAATPAPGATLLKTVTNTIALLRKLGQEHAVGTTRTLTRPQALATRSEVEDEASTPLASDTTEVAPDQTEGAPGTTETAPVIALSAESATSPMDPVSTVVNPVTNAVATVVTVVGSVPAVVAALPTSQTPVVDVITTMQQMLTSITDAVLPVMSVPSDLYTLLTAGAQPAPATIGRGAGFDVGPIAVVDVLMPPSGMPVWTQVVPSTGIWSAHGDVSALAAGGGIAAAGLSKEPSISRTAPLATQGAAPTGVLPALEHAVAALLVPISLSTLAALALPGLGGLLIVCAAGIRIGYRQAKAGLMLRASGIARFAGSRPLGVVRTGSLIALRPRPVRTARHAAPRASGLLDRAA
jgi:hypothetical protein